MCTQHSSLVFYERPFLMSLPGVSLSTRHLKNRCSERRCVYHDSLYLLLDDRELSTAAGYHTVKSFPVGEVTMA